MENKNYTELALWKEARRLVKLTYESSSSFPESEKFGLTHQIRRAAISIPSNIAEGIGRNYHKDTLQFLHISRGSVYELETQIYLAEDLNFIDSNIREAILTQLVTVKKLLSGFINYKKSLITDATKH